MRSWRTEELLNYFPDTDIRVRNLKYSLDAQLLNEAGLALDDHQQRYDREVRSRSFRSPLNIDNRGVYYSCKVPATFHLGSTPDGVLAPPQTIRGRISGSEFVQLRPYDDALPVASRIDRSTSRSPVKFTNPQLFTITGDNYPKAIGETEVQFPNRVYLRLENMPDAGRGVEVVITGVGWPAPGNGAEPAVETLTFLDEGVRSTRNAFSSIKSVAVRGLPQGATISAYSFLFSGPVPDTRRPAVDRAWRGERLSRYWNLDQNLLFGTYLRDRFTGYQVSESYLCTPRLSTIAIETKHGRNTQNDEIFRSVVGEINLTLRVSIDEHRAS
jgi:hypothetical protein